MPIGYANYGYSPVAGKWYPERVTPMPRVCHKFVRLSILKQIYTNIKNSADSSDEDLGE